MGSCSECGSFCCSLAVSEQELCVYTDTGIASCQTNAKLDCVIINTQYIYYIINGIVFDLDSKKQFILI